MTTKDKLKKLQDGLFPYEIYGTTNAVHHILDILSDIAGSVEKLKDANANQDRRLDNYVEPSIEELQEAVDKLARLHPDKPTEPEPPKIINNDNPMGLMGHEDKPTDDRQTDVEDELKGLALEIKHIADKVISYSITHAKQKGE
jgi:hypothetical protein